MIPAIIIVIITLFVWFIRRRQDYIEVQGRLADWVER